MTSQQLPHIPQDITIQLEIVPEHEQHPDIADVEEISREIVDYLRSNGYFVEPRYTGTKGIPGYDIIMHVYHIIHGHEALVAAAFSFASSALQVILKVCSLRTEKDKARRAPFEITLEMDDKRVTIKSFEGEYAAKLVEQLQQTYFASSKQVPKESSMRIKVHVPKKKRQRKP